MFFPKAEELVAEAEKAEEEGNREKASEMYMYMTSILDTDITILTFLGEPLRCTAYPDSLLPGLRSSGMLGKKARRLQGKDWLYVSGRPKK